MCRHLHGSGLWICRRLADIGDDYYSEFHQHHKRRTVCLCDMTTTYSHREKQDISTATVVYVVYIYLPA